MKELTLLFVHGEAIGYGRLGVNLADALPKLGVDVYDHLEDPTQDEAMKHLNKGRKSKLTNTVCWVSVPTHARGWYEGQHAAIFSMWESSHLPESFRETLHEFQTVIVPSKQNLELFSQYHDNVKLAYLGVDPAVWRFTPRPPVGSEFRFLIGGSGPRKGTDLAFKAFRKVFKTWPKDGPVPKLIMKNPRGEDFYADRVEVVAGRISADAEVALYADCHAYIQPCFSSDTKALTPDGPKSYRMLSPGDEVFTLNADTNELEAQPIKRMWVSPFEGEMVHFANKQVDLLVTPNHRIYYQGFNAGQRKQEWRVREASEFVGKKTRYHLPTVGIWSGDPNLFVHRDELCPPKPTKHSATSKACSVPDCRRPYYAKTVCSVHYQRLAKHGSTDSPQGSLNDKVDLRLLAGVMGWFIAEGSMTRVDRDEWVDICNTQEAYLDEIAGLLTELGLNPMVGQDRVRVYSQHLCHILRDCGKGAKNKTIPAWILQYGSEVLRPLYDGLMAGDGSRRGHHVNYHTSSDALKDRFVELCMKLGYSTKVHRRNQPERFIAGRRLAPCENWMIAVREQHHEGTLKPEQHVKKVAYSEVVWCVETENGTVVTTRNGLVTISGNSRGEGFGLQPLQAMAQGLPTILTDAHGHEAFSHLGYGIKADLKQSGYFIYGDAGDWWEPDFDELCERMEFVYSNYDQALAVGEMAAVEVAKSFTWEQTAQRFIDALGDELEKPYSGSGEWFKPQVKRYLVIFNKDWNADIAGVHYQFKKGVRYYELADVKRIAFEGGLLDPACLDTVGPNGETNIDTGLTESQLEKAGDYSAAHGYCEHCGQKLGGKTRADEIFEELELAATNGDKYA